MGCYRLNVFQNRGSWQKNAAVQPSVVETPDGPVILYADPQQLFSPWSFDYFGGGEAADAGPFNKLTLQVEGWETRINELTDQRFYMASGRLRENLPPLEVCLTEESRSVPPSRAQ